MHGFGPKSHAFCYCQSSIKAPKPYSNYSARILRSGSRSYCFYHYDDDYYYGDDDGGDVKRRTNGDEEDKNDDGDDD